MDTFMKIFLGALVTISTVIIVAVMYSIVTSPSMEEAGIKTDSNSWFKIVCMNGVEYYQGSSKLAPVVDANTLTFKRCTFNK